MSKTNGGHGRRAAAVAALAGVCVLAPMTSAQAATEHGASGRWNYVDTFATERLCEKAGVLLEIFGKADDHRCVERYRGYALFTRTDRYGPYDRD